MKTCVERGGYTLSRRERLRGLAIAKGCLAPLTVEFDNLGGAGLRIYPTMNREQPPGHRALQLRVILTLTHSTYGVFPSQLQTFNVQSNPPTAVDQERNLRILNQPKAATGQSLWEWYCIL